MKTFRSKVYKATTQDNNKLNNNNWPISGVQIVNLAGNAEMNRNAHLWDMFFSQPPAHRGVFSAYFSLLCPHALIA